MATTVAQTYTGPFNISITKRNGVISKVTTWQTGMGTKSTKTVETGE